MNSKTKKIFLYCSKSCNSLRGKKCKEKFLTSTQRWAFYIFLKFPLFILSK